MNIEIYFMDCYTKNNILILLDLKYILKEKFYNYFQKYYFYRYILLFTINLPNLRTFFKLIFILILRYITSYIIITHHP